MKKILFLFVFCSSFASEGISQFHFGGGGQLIFDSTIFGAQGKLFYEYDETWRGAGSFTLHFNDGINWTIDLDAHYLLLDIGESFNLAPVAGLAITNFDSGSDIGINLGAFIDLNFESRHIYIEPKIVLSGVRSVVVSGGVFF